MQDRSHYQSVHHVAMCFPGGVICGSLVNRYTGQVGRLACPKFLHLRML